MRIKGVGKCKPSALSQAQEALLSLSFAASASVSLHDDELMGKGKESPTKEGLFCGLTDLSTWITAPPSISLLCHPCVTSLLEVSSPRGPGWAPL